MNNTTLIQHLLMMKNSIEEISDKNERMCVLARYLITELEEASRKDPNMHPAPFRLAEVLEDMLSEVYAQNQIEQRLSELLAVYDPPEKKSVA